MFIVVTVISLCFIFNVGAIIFFLQGSGILGDRETNYFSKETQLIGALISVGVVSAYYLIGKRHQAIYQRLKEKYIEPPKTWYSILVVVIHYILSFGLLLIMALYKNQDWIFAVK